MALVICMAGLNTRFHDAGFDIPKYLLPWAEKTIIHEILKKLDYSGKIFLLANKRDIYFKKQLEESVKGVSETPVIINYIGDTAGQAATAAIAAEWLRDSNEPFFIHNGDTVLLNRNLTLYETLLVKQSALIDIFVGNSPKYCYIRTSDSFVSEIAEKKAISPFASSGLYGFKNANIFMEYYHLAQDMVTDREIYVSDVLKQMIKVGEDVVVNALDNEAQTIVLGSPAEYGLELARKQLNL